jgi:predicted ATP-dependent Lon-type protease
MKDWGKVKRIGLKGVEVGANYVKEFEKLLAGGI